MTEGFLMVPWRAIQACKTTDQLGAVVDLYKLAERTKGAPVPVARVYLMQRWNKSRRFVTGILDLLRSAGCLEVVNGGGKRCAKTVLLKRSINGPKAVHKRSKTNEVEPGQDSKRGPKAVHKRSKSEPHNTRKEKKREADLDLAEVWDEHLKHHNGNKQIPGYAKKAIGSAFKLGECTTADLVALVRAANLSDHPLFARDIRAEGWSNGIDRSGSLATIFRHDKLAMRIQAAQEWSGSETAAAEFNKIKKALRGHPLDLSETGLKALKKIGGMTTLGRSTDLTDLRTRYLVEYNQQERQT